MNAFKRIFGLDPIDFLIQGIVTGLLMGFVDSTMHSSGRDGLMMMTAGASFVLYAVRRHWALRKLAGSEGLTTGQMAAARIEELEARVAQLEEGERHVAELEERLDFAERLIAQGTGERASLPEAERR